RGVPRGLPGRIWEPLRPARPRVVQYRHRRLQDLHDAVVGAPEAAVPLGELQPDELDAVRSWIGPDGQYAVIVELRQAEHPARRAAFDAVCAAVYVVARPGASLNSGAGAGSA